MSLNISPRSDLPNVHQVTRMTCAERQVKGAGDDQVEKKTSQETDSSQINVNRATLLKRVSLLEEIREEKLNPGLIFALEQELSDSSSDTMEQLANAIAPIIVAK